MITTESLELIGETTAAATEAEEAKYAKRRDTTTRDRAKQASGGKGDYLGRDRKSMLVS